MADPLFYKYYDDIYSTKDYRSEVETILNVYRNIKGRVPCSVLDVGCGTGGHSCHFSMKGIKAVGTDVDRDSILVAQHKAANLDEPKPVFLCEDVTTVGCDGFDLAVSLFNVVSYIGDVDYMRRFFEAIRDRLVDGGLLVFDCWNGLAAVADPPKIKTTEVRVDKRSIMVETRPTIDMMEQTVEVSNQVRVSEAGKQPQEFEYGYTQYLWTPALLKSVLEKSGFEVANISAAMRPDIKAHANTWKIMFTCLKRQGNGGQPAR